jgi:hypothetical protein
VLVVPFGQCCKTCRFWIDRSIDNPFGEDGVCKAHPAEEPMDAHDWCGEYATDNPQTVTESAATLARFVLLGDMTAARALADNLRETD